MITTEITMKGHSRFRDVGIIETIDVDHLSKQSEIDKYD